ncbi:MAG: hypothetical protein V8S82_02410 [Eubacteriales bacterium]
MSAFFLPGDDERNFEASLCELERLTETAGGKVIAKLTQNRETPSRERISVRERLRS